MCNIILFYFITIIHNKIVYGYLLVNLSNKYFLKSKKGNGFLTFLKMSIFDLLNLFPKKTL